MKEETKIKERRKQNKTKKDYRERERERIKKEILLHSSIRQSMHIQVFNNCEFD
jgi:uncharacterized protein YvpB